MFPNIFIPIAMLSVGIPALDALAGESARLFVIERDLNANVVCYDVNITDRGRFRASQPIDVYWLMKAEDGRREDLNWFENSHVYGISVHLASPPTNLSMTIKALESRPISVSIAAGKPLAEIEISGKAAVLDKVYVKQGHGLFPGVDSVDLFGTDPQSGRLLHEVLHP